MTDAHFRHIIAHFHCFALSFTPQMGQGSQLGGGVGRGGAGIKFGGVGVGLQ